MAKLETLSMQDYSKAKTKLCEKVKVKAHLGYMQWLTVREAARQLKLTQDGIIELVNETEGLDLIVGFRAHNGIGEHQNKGDYTIEYYE